MAIAFKDVGSPHHFPFIDLHFFSFVLFSLFFRFFNLWKESPITISVFVGGLVVLSLLLKAAVVAV